MSTQQLMMTQQPVTFQQPMMTQQPMMPFQQPMTSPPQQPQQLMPMMSSQQGMMTPPQQGFQAAPQPIQGGQSTWQQYNSQQQYNTQPYNSQQYYSQPYNSQPYNSQPYNSQPYNAQPYNSQPYNAQPYNSQPYNAQPYNSQQSNSQQLSDSQPASLTSSGPQGKGDSPPPGAPGGRVSSQVSSSFQNRQPSYSQGAHTTLSSTTNQATQKQQQQQQQQPYERPQQAHKPVPAPVSSSKKGIQFLVTAEGGTLPDVSDISRYFQRYGDVDVDSIEDGHLLTFGERGWDYPRSLDEWKQHTVAGHHVQVNLVVQDIYGCQVTVTQDHVEVKVGREVIYSLMRDEQWRNSILSKTLIYVEDAVCVRYLTTGYISVAKLAAGSTLYPWRWKLFVVRILNEMLRPFKAAFPSAPLDVRDRSLERCRSRSVQRLSSPRSRHCQTDAIVELDAMSFALVSRNRFSMKMNIMYPGMQSTCNAEDFELILSGEGNAAEKAAKRIVNLTRDTIPLTDTQALMMKKVDAQNWFETVLIRHDIDCVWKLQQSDASRLGLSVSSKTPGPESRDSNSVISVLASASDVQQFTHVFQFCFQTAVVVLCRSEVGLLQSDTWKQFADDLQKPCIGRVTPVLKVRESKISICDVTSNIDSTRRAVHSFFVADKGRQLVNRYSRGARHKDQQLQTEDVKASTADRQQQTEVQHHHNKEQQTDAIPTEDKRARLRIRTDEKSAQTERHADRTEETLTEACASRHHNKTHQTTETRLQRAEIQTQTRIQTQTFDSHRLCRGEQSTGAEWQAGEARAQVRTEVHGVRRQVQQPGASDQPNPEDTGDGDRPWMLLKSAVRSQDDSSSQAASADSDRDTASSRHSDDVSDGDTGSSHRSSDVSDRGIAPSDGTDEVREVPLIAGSLNITENQHITKETISNTGNALTRGDQRCILPVSLRTVKPLSANASDSASSSDSPSVNSLGTSASSLTLEKERERRRQQLTPQSHNSMTSSGSSPRVRRTRSLHEPVTQQPGGSTGPRTRVAPAPRAPQGHTERGVNSTDYEPRADGFADRSPERAKHLGNSGQRHALSAAVGHESDNNAGMCGGHDSRSSAERSTDPRTRPQNQRFRSHDDLSGTTTSNTGYTNSHYIDSSNYLHLSLDSATLARLSHLEIRLSPRDGERAHEPSVPLETRIIHMQHQLDQLMHRRDDSPRQQSSSHSGGLVIGNPSASHSASASPSRMSGQQQQQQQGQ